MIWVHPCSLRATPHFLGRLADFAVTDESYGRQVSGRSTISSISSPRPKQALGTGEGDSLGMLNANIRYWIHH